jgi:hypothetical protein
VCLGLQVGRGPGEAKLREQKVMDKTQGEPEQEALVQFISDLIRSLR